MNQRFDGDEMNLFLPQSPQTVLELQEIASVEKQLISPKSSSPIIGIVQDGLLGAFNLSQPTIKIDWKSAMNIVSYTFLEDFSKIKKDIDYNGIDLFSLIIPPTINTDSPIEIKNGKIIKGPLNKSSLGSGKPHSLIHLIWNEYG